MLKVLGVPAFEDNYLWLIHDGIHAAAVDPGDAHPILAALEAHRLTLVAILLTHHHPDHVGGVAELASRYEVPVYGPRERRIAGITVEVDQDSEITMPQLGLRLSVINVPGHTLSHIAFYAERQHWLFCGDTLFAGGCGRLFEGSPAQMAASLARLSALPDDTQVYCAHEYTIANLRFAMQVEPDNVDLCRRYALEKDKRDKGLPTIPSTIGLEKRTNPFLRCDSVSINDTLRERKNVTSDDPIEVFAALREWKNNFR